MVKIFYDGKDVFSGLAPTPIVGRSLNPVGSTFRCGLLDSITLNGQITGVCNNTFSGMWQRFQELTNRFSKNFQSFIVSGDSDGIVYKADYAVIKNISIGEDKWVGLIPFTIEIDIYNSGDFNCFYGVTDVSNQFSFSDNNDCTVSLIHSISAQGFTTNKTAIQNAKDYVHTVSGWSSQVSPNFIKNPENVILLSVEEKVNRLAGTYQLTENYLYDPNNLSHPNHGLLKYSLDYSNENHISSVKINGRIIGGRTSSLTYLRDTFDAINFYSIANKFYKIFSNDDLSNIPRSFNSNENTLENTLDFSIEYSNEIIEDPYLIDNIKIENDYISNNYCIAFNGSIQSYFGCGQDKWNKVYDYYKNFNLDDYILENWSLFGDYRFNLSNVPNSKSYGEDKVNSIITIGVEYCNNKGDNFGDVQDFNYSISFQPGINQYRPKAILHGEGLYCIQDLNYRKRQQFQIQGSAKVSSCGSINGAIQDVKEKINLIASNYLIGENIILMNENINLEDNKSISFSATWSMYGNDIIPNSLK